MFGQNAFAEVRGEKGSKNKTDRRRPSFHRRFRLIAVAIDRQVNDKPRLRPRAVRRKQRHFAGRGGRSTNWARSMAARRFGSENASQPCVHFGELVAELR